MWLQGHEDHLIMSFVFIHKNQGTEGMTGPVPRSNLVHDRAREARQQCAASIKNLLGPNTSEACTLRLPPEPISQTCLEK